MDPTIALFSILAITTVIVAATAMVTRNDGYGQRPERADYDTRNPS